MTDLHAQRLILHPVDMAEAERIAGRRPGDADRWADDFPSDGEVIGAAAYVGATEALGEQRPFGFYRITRIADGRAIGGIGFKGPPDSGSAEVGYGLAPSARGNGYAAEALAALLDVARAHGLDRILADTDEDNVASRRTLERVGFRLTRCEGHLCFYELRLGTG